MSKFAKISLIVFVGLSCVQECGLRGQEYDFFWSTHELNGGAQNGPLFVSVDPGETLSLYLYFSSNGVSDQDLDGGALLDLATSQSGVIKFLNAETFNPQITVQDIFVDYRWYEPDEDGDELGAAGEIGCVSDNEINEWGAFGIVSEGMIDNNTGQIFMDEGYDTAADAFLFGRVDIEIVGQFRSCVQIHAGRGRGGIVIGQGFFDSEFFEPVFAPCVIGIRDDSVGDLLLGDANLDGQLNLLDVAPFIDAINAPEFIPEVDTNCDGFFNLLDVAPFIRILNGSGLVVVDPTVEDDKPKNGQLGDSNGDGFVDLLDAECYADIGIDCGWGVDGADLNGDGVLDLFDLYLFPDVILKLK